MCGCRCVCVCICMRVCACHNILYGRLGFPGRGSELIQTMISAVVCVCAWGITRLVRGHMPEGARL